MCWIIFQRRVFRWAFWPSHFSRAGHGSWPRQLQQCSTPPWDSRVVLPNLIQALNHLQSKAWKIRFGIRTTPPFKNITAVDDDHCFWHSHFVSKSRTFWSLPSLLQNTWLGIFLNFSLSSFPSPAEPFFLFSHMTTKGRHNCWDSPGIRVRHSPAEWSPELLYPKPLGPLFLSKNRLASWSAFVLQWSCRPQDRQSGVLWPQAGLTSVPVMY